MSGLSDFFQKGILMFLGDTLGLLRAVLSIVGLFMILISVLVLGITLLLSNKGKVPVTTLVAGFVMCLMFGFSYGLTYFDIVL